MNFSLRDQELTLNAPITTVVDDVHKIVFHCFSERIKLNVSSELAEDSHEISSLIFFER